SPEPARGRPVPPRQCDGTLPLGVRPLAHPGPQPRDPLRRALDARPEERRARPPDRHQSRPLLLLQRLHPAHRGRPDNYRAGPPPAALHAPQRPRAALFLAGLLGTGSPFALTRGLTNDNRWPATRRMFVGWRFAVHGLVVVFAFTALIVAIFQKDVTDPEVVR